VLTQLTVPGEARPLKIALEAIYTSSFIYTSLPIFAYISETGNEDLVPFPVSCFVILVGILIR